MDFEQYSGYAKAGYDITSNWKTFADLDLTNFKASNPGAANMPLIDNDADITRGVTSFSLEKNYDKTSGALKLYYNFGSHKINDGYSLGTEPKDYRFRSNDIMTGITLYQNYSLFAENQTTAGFDFQHFGGHAWNRYLDGREDSDIIKKSINEVAGYINFQQTLASKFVLNAGIRLDHDTNTGTEWVPQAGVSYIATENTIIKGIVSKGFRNPTIREMYMFPPQNPDLKAERLMNYEISASQNLLNKALNLDMSLYYIDGSNSIRTVIIDNKPLNVNTGKIKNYGLEFATQYKIYPYLSLSANYSFLHMKYKITAAPEHKLYAGVNYSCNKWILATGIQFIDGLYTVLENKNTNTKAKTETFALWNTRAAYKPINILEIFVRGENLLVQKYEINAGYPMPRSTIFGGIGLKF
jgi:iron complex outermembrane receptor protein